MLQKVNKGQKYTPSARFHNKVVDVVNSFDGIKSIGVTKGQSNAIRVNFINTLTETISAGTPLVINTYNEENDIFTIRKFQNEDVFFGVSKNTVAPGDIGIMILSGVVKISVSGNPKKYVYPIADSFDWQYSDGGMPVLCSATDGVLVLVGASCDCEKNTNRPFWVTHNQETGMLDITEGWVIGNGEKLLAKADSLGVQNGYICVTSELVGVNYKEPTFKYGEFAPNCIPIACVSVENGIVQIVNFFVSTAVFLETNLHPPCECLGE